MGRPRHATAAFRVSYLHWRSTEKVGDGAAQPQCEQKWNRAKKRAKWRLYAQRQTVRQRADAPTLLDVLQWTLHHHPQQEDEMRLQTGWQSLQWALAVLRQNL